MNFQIKKIDIKDVKTLYKWVNSEDSLKNKLLTESRIEIKTHIKWIRKYLSDNKYNLIWMIFFNNKRVGQVRMDGKKEEKVFVTDIFLDSKYRGRGIAKKAYQILINKMKKKFTNYKIIANIKKNNKNSHAFFNRLGFNIVDEKKNFIIFKKDL